MEQPQTGFAPALQLLAQAAKAEKPTLVAIDGRCGSGKTTLAALAAAQLACNVVHTDDYYLPLDRRAADWAQTPAANMDLTRFREEVLLPAKRGESIRYRPYDCQSGSYIAETVLPPQPLTVVEGSYSLHPALAALYDETIFLTCPPAVQEERLRRREGAYFETFRTRWIPLEEAYFARYAIPLHSGLMLDTGGFVDSDAGAIPLNCAVLP